MKSTLRDIADAAGVSVMAVSAVLNGGGRNVKVGFEKAELIKAKARELDYRANFLAQSLRTRRTQTVGVVFQHLAKFGDRSAYFFQLLDGIMSALFPHDYTLALCPRLARAGDARRIEDGRFDGVLWCRPDFTEASVDYFARSSVPVVMMHAPAGSSSSVPTFTADNDKAMDRVVRHLVELGHESIGFVVDCVTAPTAEGRARSNAFLKAVAEHGVFGEVLIWRWDSEELAAYVGGGPHTALSVYSDSHAGCILTRAAQLGIRVPDDLSVVGFDSSEFCEGTKPRLTSVNQPVERMALEATQCLLNLIHSERSQSHSVLFDPVLYDCELDIRQSTAHPLPHRRGK
jgi:LacI family transcriptional regulator